MIGATNSRNISSSPLQLQAAPRDRRVGSLTARRPLRQQLPLVAVSYPASTRSKPRFSTDSDRYARERVRAVRGQLGTPSWLRPRWEVVVSPGMIRDADAGLRSGHVSLIQPREMAATRTSVEPRPSG